MAFAFVVENGSGRADANAFASVAAVDDVLAASPFTAAWLDDDASDKELRICEASRWLSDLSWVGVPRVSGQALAWPRVGVLDERGFPLPVDAVPAFVVQATARLAWSLRGLGSTPRASTGLLAGTDIAIGPIRLTPDGGGQLPPDVVGLIRRYASVGGSSRLARV